MGVSLGKRLLKVLKVIRQIDNKFIAYLAKGVLCDSSEVNCHSLMINQHAAHERFKLKNFRMSFSMHQQTA